MSNGLVMFHNLPVQKYFTHVTVIILQFEMKWSEIRLNYGEVLWYENFTWNKLNYINAHNYICIKLKIHLININNYYYQ